MSIEVVLVEIKCGVEELIFEEEFIVKFKENCLLWIKLGVDLMVLDIYLGYMVIFNKFCIF